MKLKIGAKLGIGFGVILVLTFGGGALSYYRLTIIKQDAARITTMRVPTMEAARMSRNVAEAAKGAGEVAQAAQSTSHGATDSQKAAKSLAEMSTHLRELVGRFKLDGSKRSAATKRKTNAGRSSRPAERSAEFEEELATT